MITRRAAHGRPVTFVIPGRAQREPGIHNHGYHVDIPG